MSFLVKKIKKIKFKILIIALALFIFSDYTHGVVVDIQGLNYIDIFSVRVYCGVNELFHLKDQCTNKVKNLSNIINNYDIAKIDTASLEEKLLALEAQLNSLQSQPDKIQYMPYGILSVGPQGPQGPAGPQGTSGLNQYVYVSTGGGTTTITNSLTFSTSTNTLVSNVNGISSSVFLNTPSPCIATGTGTNNTCYGEGALQQNTSGSNNTSLGYYSGNNITSGSNNITLGANTNVYSPTSSGQLNIGNVLFGSGLTGSLSSPSGILSVGTSSINSLSTGGDRGLVIDSGISHTSGLRLINIAASSSVPANSYILGAASSSPTAITMDSAGNIYTANIGSSNVTKITPDGISTIIGNTGAYPSDIITDSFGNVYVSNSSQSSNSVTKITPSGVVSILGTTGNSPSGIAIDSAGNIYTTNYADNTVSKITPSGVSTVFATTGFHPRDLVFDNSGNLYTVNTGDNSVTKITPGGVSSYFATTGTYPEDIAIDNDGNLYTANQNSLNVTKITPAGVTSILGNTETIIRSIGVDSEGNVYVVAGILNYNRIAVISPTGATSYIDIVGNGPGDIAISPTGDIYTANYWSNNVTKVTKPAVSSFLTTDTLGNVVLKNYSNTLNFSTTSKVLTSSVNGLISVVDLSSLTPESLWSRSGTSSNIYNSLLDNVMIGTSTFSSFTTGAARGLIIDSGTPNTSGLRLTNLSPYTSGVSSIIGTTGINPQGVVFDSVGNVYTANSSSDSVTKITPSGVSTILGTTGSQPYAVTIDSVGNVYTANSGSNNVSKITPSGVSSILGTTGSGPYGIAIDLDGNIYTANYNDNNVSKITPSGVSTIFATTGAGPFGITTDSSGNVYTTNADAGTVSKITSGGVSSILGTTGSFPQGIVLDNYGNVYVANYYDNTVSKITQLGVSTVLGTTGSSPYAIAIDNFGNIYVANQNSNNVSKITQTGVSSIIGTTGSGPSGISIDTIGNIYVANQNSNNISKLVSSDLNVLSTDSDGNVILSAVVSQNLLSNTIYSLNQRLANDAPITIVNDSNLFSTGLKGTGSGVSTSTGSIFLGSYAGYQALAADNSNFLGFNSGYSATNANNSNFFGYYSGYQATNANISNFFGSSAGFQATNANSSNFFGLESGYIATNAHNSNFFGYHSGYGATNANNSNFFGQGAGSGATNASYSNLFGYHVGQSPTSTVNNLGSNNIIIGTNISLPDATSNALNIGGIIFGTGTHSSTSGDPSIVPTNGKIGIGVVNPTAGFQVSNNISASSGSATGVLFNNTLTPSANFNTLIGLDVNPVFDHSVFGTTTDIGIRNRGTLRLVASSNPNNYGDLSYSTDAFIQTDSNTNIKSGGGKYYGVSSGSYYQVGQYGDAIITNGWSNFSVSGLSYDQPSIARSHPSSPYNQNLLSFTGTLNSGSGAANNSLLNGLYTKLTDNSSNTVINILNGVYSDVSAGTNTSAIRNSGIFIGGNFGINTTAPQYTLDVGNSSTTGIIARFTNNTGSCTLDNTGLSCPSDINLKKNITKLVDGTPFTLSTITLVSSTTLDKINALDSVMYNWKGESDTSSKHVGFIAQQVEQLFPDLVTIDNKTNLRTLNYSNFTPYLVQSIKELNNKALFASVGSSTLINNTINTSLNDLSLLIASTTDNTIISTTLTNLHDLFSTSSLSAIKALTNTLTQTGFDLNLNGNALTNVKSIQSMSGNWRIGEDGLITAKIIRANGIELKDVDGNWYCYGSQNGSLVKVGPAPCSDSDLGNSGSVNTQPISTPIVTSSATDTSTTTNSTVDTPTTTVEETVTTQEPVPNLEIIP